MSALLLHGGFGAHVRLGSGAVRVLDVDQETRTRLCAGDVVVYMKAWATRGKGDVEGGRHKEGGLGIDRAGRGQGWEMVKEGQLGADESY